LEALLKGATKYNSKIAQRYSETHAQVAIPPGLFRQRQGTVAGTAFPIPFIASDDGRGRMLEWKNAGQTGIDLSCLIERKIENIYCLAASDFCT
jgi:hypothetical protein